MSHTKALNLASSKRNKPPDLQAAFNKLRSEFGVACLTSSVAKTNHAARNLLMWSHYAQEHTGICFQFHVPSAPVQLAVSLRVEYSDDFVRINWAERETAGVKVAEALRRKARAWSYEGERRIIVRLAANTPLPFQPAGLVGVILGMRASDSTVELVAQRCADRNHTHGTQTRIFRAQKVPGHYRLEVRRALDLEVRAYGRPAVVPLTR